MKFLILQADGMPDHPIKELGNKTPLEVADIPNIKSLAKNCIMGMMRTIPDGYPPGSDVGNLSILGYDPRKYYTGRAPLEALSMGLNLDEKTVAYRCNLVTLERDNNSLIMKDYSAGHITTEEARELILFLNKNLKREGIEFHPGISYRHIMLWKDGKADYKCTPPHDITGEKIDDYLPSNGDGLLEELIFKSMEILHDHPVNKKRIKAGKNPANSIWLWGQGKATVLPSIQEKYGLTGAVIAGVDLIKGIGKAAGLEVINVEGATGYLDTNYRGKGSAALNALKNFDLVFVHLEAPDEAGHNGNFTDKIKAIERFDRELLGTVMEGLTPYTKKGVTLLVLSDHPTPCAVKTHVAEPVPFLIYSTHIKNGMSIPSLTESYAKKTGLFIDSGWDLLDNVIREKFFS